MKIAAVSEDGSTISRHFGRAPYYVVVTVENGLITAKETRDKLGHAQFASGEHEHGEHGHGEHGGGGHGHGHGAGGGQGHGFGAESHSRHHMMAAAIDDCEALLARGMGAGAYQSLQSLNIQPKITDIANIEDAVRAYVDGTLVDHIERLH
ncbi:MAG: dinitrogenase iron-molybdenum cofactor biosynthesis protein [Ignavibacteria bacterium]|nr:dinitrogenase iron-molybdenum cofactor biosynthesis protein [Ignavibacteria bacterium]